MQACSEPCLLPVLHGVALQSSIMPALGTHVANELSASTAPGMPGPAGGGSAGASKHALFNGIRVRMGIATGLLPPGQGAKGSAVMDMAKGELLAVWVCGGDLRQLQSFALSQHAAAPVPVQQMPALPQSRIGTCVW
jgi:hypothetical protein